MKFPAPLLLDYESPRARPGPSKRLLVLLALLAAASLVYHQQLADPDARPPWAPFGCPFAHPKVRWSTIGGEM